MALQRLGGSFVRKCISDGPNLYSPSFSGGKVSWTSTGSPSVFPRFFSDKKSNTSIDETDAPVHPHLRPPRKLRQVTSPTSVDPEDSTTSGEKKQTRVAPPLDHQLSIVSYCTAAEYKLEALKKHLQSWRTVYGESRYQLADSFLTDELVENAVHYKLSRQVAEAVKKAVPAEEQGDVFIFSEGSVVFWNVPEKDANVVLKALEQFEVKPYPRSIVEHEAEYLHYSYMDRSDSPDLSESSQRTVPITQMAKLTPNGQILLDKSAKTLPDFSLIKYAFSDAIAMSVKLATYESLLQQYVTSIENVAEDMKTKGRVALTKDQVLRKTGELFDLRHDINLGSNMLDPPDFYWDRENLESLYRLMCAYLNISRRTKVINEKLNHCYALVEFFRDHLNNEKSVRLELWIIALITVEVVFEMLHFGQAYLKDQVVLGATGDDASHHPKSLLTEEIKN